MFKSLFVCTLFCALSATLMTTASIKAQTTQRPKIMMAHAMQWSMPGSDRFSRDPFQANKTQSYYENAPLVFPINDEDNGALIQTFIDAKVSGLDAINMHVHNENPQQLRKLMHRLLDAAKASKTDVKVFPLIAGIMKQKNFEQFLKVMWEDPYTREHPNFLRIDNKPVIITYAHRPAKQWEVAKANAKAVGGEFFLINDTSCLEIGVTENVPTERLHDGIQAVDGLYYFASGTLGLPGHDKGPLANFMKFGHSFNPPKYTGASIRPGYIGTTRVGNLLSPRATSLFRKQWLEAIDNNPDFIHLTTVNDYGEGTSQECSVNNSFTYIDLNRYFGHRWKTGNWPSLEKPQAFLSYRKAVVGGEPVTFELVYLTANQTNLNIDATVKLQLPQGKTVELKPINKEQLPGHVVLDFELADGITQDGFGIPSVTITVDGKPIALPKADGGAFAIVRNGEEVVRRWLRMPLHRLAENVQIKMAVKGSPANLYPRTIFLENVPWEKTAGYIIERGGHSLNKPTDAKPIRDDFGFLEMFDEGFGYAPMKFTDVKTKRRVVDIMDRYTAVIRFKDNTIAYARPAMMDAPHVDPATVMDLIIQPRRGLLRDRGMYNRDQSMQNQEPATRPVIARPRNGKPWIMRFDGKDDHLSFGPLNMPAGPLTLAMWVRPEQLDKPAVICDQKGAAMGVAILKDQTIQLLRVDINRKAVWLKGQTPLAPKRWHYVVGVYDGRNMQLYVDGKADGQPVPCRGLRTDEGIVIGRGAALPHMLAQFKPDKQGFFQGDIARFQILQRALASDEIEAIYHQQQSDF